MVEGSGRPTESRKCEIGAWRSFLISTCWQPSFRYVADIAHSSGRATVTLVPPSIGIVQTPRRHVRAFTRVTQASVAVPNRITSEFGQNGRIHDVTAWTQIVGSSAFH